MNWGMFLRYFIRALLDIKLKLVLLFTVVNVLVVTYLCFETPSYITSWVVLLPGTERGSTINIDNLGEARSNGSNAYGSVSISPKNTYKEIALSDAVINTAAQEYGVPAHSFSKPRITLIDQTPAMKFTLKGESKEELKYRSNLYNAVFHKTLDALRSNEIDRTFQGVETNLAKAKQRLSEARRDIVDYQVSSSIVSDQQFERWINDAEQLKIDNTTTSVKLAQLQALIAASLNQLGVSKEQARSLLTLQANPTVRAVLAILSTKLAEQARLRSLYAPAHPERQKVTRETQSLTKEIRDLLSAVPDMKKIPDNQLYGLLANSNTETIKQLNTELANYEGLSAQKAELNASYEYYLQRLKTHTKDAATLADLQRAHQIAEAIFSSALAKLDTSRLEIYATYPLTQLLTRPGATITRDRIQAKLMIVAAVLVYGLLALALILKQIRQTIQRDEESNQRTVSAITNWYQLAHS